MDFRELINKIDAVNAEAKKEPERLSFDDAINHVKDITFTPPTQSGIKFSSANNMKFKGKDVNDPKIKLALFQDELKNSPARLLGEIASRIKPSSDAQMDLSGHVGMLGEKLAQGNMMLSQLSKPEQKLAIEVIKQALRSMELERDPDADIEYKDDDEPDAKEMESTQAPVEEEEKEEEPVAEEETWFNNLSDVTLHGDDFYETFGWIEENDEHVEEAEYQGRNVKLNKPMRGDVKKFKVYVKNPKGNVVKVNFGDPTMRIKKSNPARRRSFRAINNCDSPGPKHKARYWSCKKW